MKKIATLLILFFSVSISQVSAQNTSTCPSFFRSITFGMEGADVLSLQKFLNQQGVLDTSNLTGYFGYHTQSAVETFQMKNVIVSTGSPTTTGFGMVGPKTRATIHRICEETTPQTSIPEGSPVVITKSLFLGLRDIEVSLLQQFLKNKGFYSYPEITGYFGLATELSVKAFQNAYGLETVGNVGPLTRAKIKELSLVSIAIDTSTDTVATSSVTSIIDAPALTTPPSQNSSLPDTSWMQYIGYGLGYGGGSVVSDTTPPSISSASSTVKILSATISWNTDENANALIEYGTSTVYGSATSSTVFSTSKTFTLTDLAASTVYNYRLTSTDEHNNTSISNNFTFTTGDFEPESTALFARASTTLADMRKEDMNTFIATLKNNNIWSKLDVLYLLTAPTEQIAFLNWKDDTRNLTKNGTMTLVPSLGMRGDGTTGYLSGIGLATTLTEFEQNSAHMGIFITHAQNQNAHIGRSTSNGEAFINASQTGTSFTSRLNNDNTGGTASWPIENPIGHSLVVRPDSSQLLGYKNGTLFEPKVSTSKAIQASTILIGRVSSTYTSDTIASVSMGASLSQSESETLHSALEAFMSTLGWNPIPEATTRTLSLQSAVNTPDASGGDPGEGFTNTGLVHDPTDGTWWLGNDGRGISGDIEFEPSVVHLSADFSTVINDFVLSEIASTSTNKHSIQGIAYDTSDNTLWFIAKDTVGNNTRIYHITKAGLVLGSTLVSAAYNGITYDSLRDQLILSNPVAFNWFNKGTSVPVGNSLRAIVGEPDQLFYDAVNDHLLYTTGANGSDGHVVTVDLTTEWGAPVTIKNEILVGADAIEGISVVNGMLYLTNDGYFHPGNPVKNRILIYDYE